MILGRSGLKSYALHVFPLNYSTLEQLANCCGSKEVKSNSRWRDWEGDEIVTEWGGYHLLDVWLNSVNTPSFRL